MQIIDNLRLLFIFIFISLNVSLYAQDSETYRATTLIKNEVELTIEAFEIVKSCHQYYYHYGYNANIESKSLSGKSYNISFNVYIYSALGTGQHAYGGSFTISNSTPNLYNKSIFNNGKKVTSSMSEFTSYPCSTLTIDDVGVEKVRIDYWGNIGGQSINGSSTEDLLPSKLPIELVSFESSVIGSYVELEWITGSELNNEYFDIERSSDSNNYIVLGQIKGAGNSSSNLKYEFTDHNLPSGIYYYRLKQVDYNGRYEYHGPISAEIKNKVGTKQYRIFPNPSSNGEFDIESDKFISGTILIYDSLGNTLSEIHFKNKKNIPVHLNNESGIYFLTLKSEYSTNAIFTEKLLIER